MTPLETLRQKVFENLDSFQYWYFYYKSDKSPTAQLSATARFLLRSSFTSEVLEELIRFVNSYAESSGLSAGRKEVPIIFKEAAAELINRGELIILAKRDLAIVKSPHESNPEFIQFIGEFLKEVKENQEKLEWVTNVFSEYAFKTLTRRTESQSFGEAAYIPLSLVKINFEEFAKKTQLNTFSFEEVMELAHAQSTLLSTEKLKLKLVYSKPLCFMRSINGDKSKFLTSTHEVINHEKQKVKRSFLRRELKLKTEYQVLDTRINEILDDLKSGTTRAVPSLKDELMEKMNQRHKIFVEANKKVDEALHILNDSSGLDL